MSNDNKKTALRTALAGAALLTAFGVGRSSVKTPVTQPAAVTNSTSTHGGFTSPTSNATSSNSASQGKKTESKPTATEVRDYVLNTSSHKIHLPNCSSVGQMLDKNKETVHDSIRHIIEEDGRYSTCGNCLKGIE